MSEISYSEISLENRLDSEFYQKKFILNDRFLKSKKHFKIDDYFKVTDGEHGNVLFRDDGVKYLGAENIKKGFLDISKIKYVDEGVNQRNLRSEVHVGNVLISIKGTLGEVAVAERWLLPANMSRDVAILKKKYNIISPYLLSIFLMTEFGRLQSSRGGSGGVQQMITLGRLRKFIVPYFKSGFSEKIEKLFQNSLKKRELSKQLYTQAEDLLLAEVGLKDFSPSTEAVNIKSFSESFGTSGRLDAEYYQPKYEEIERAIKNYANGFERLDKFINNYSTGYPYKSSTYINEDGIPLIRINNIYKGNLDISNAVQIPLTDEKLSPKDIANENDILISMSGTIGNSCKIPRGIKALVNQRIMRITSKNFNHEVLPLLINSPLGMYQLNRIGTGGVQTNISSTDIKNILIPKIRNKKQQQIAQLVEQSFALKAQSEQLLEVAKRAVEIAIEQDENVAMAYIKKEVGENE